MENFFSIRSLTSRRSKTAKSGAISAKASINQTQGKAFKSQFDSGVKTEEVLTARACALNLSSEQSPRPYQLRGSMNGHAPR